MKKFISISINIDLFCKNPSEILKKNNYKIISVSKKNKPEFYVISPNLFKDIFDIKNYLNNDNSIPEKKKYMQKFSMHKKWTPDKDFLRQSQLWGINLKEEVSSSELASFISFWKAEGCLFYHIQWQQKLARSVKKSRSMSYIINKKRNINDIPIPDQNTPNGFRGE